jgi:hypothetical protein
MYIHTYVLLTWLHFLLSSPQLRREKAKHTTRYTTGECHVHWQQDLTLTLTQTCTMLLLYFCSNSYFLTQTMITTVCTRGHSNWYVLFSRDLPRRRRLLSHGHGKLKLPCLNIKLIWRITGKNMCSTPCSAKDIVPAIYWGNTPLFDLNEGHIVGKNFLIGQKSVGHMVWSVGYKKGASLPMQKAWGWELEREPRPSP